MKVLIVGAGAREHAIAWKLLQDDPLLDIVVAPGNPGIATIARCVPIRPSDVGGLLAFARAESVDLTVVGPEGPLEAGIVDEFRTAGLDIFGPTRRASRIETSKRYAKGIMEKAGVPTAHASHHTTVESALRAAHELGAPVVIKASGLAAGKGVVVAATMNEAELAINDMLVAGTHGDAGREILVEEFMEGEELSVFALCGKHDFRLMIGSQDHKRLQDGDLGPNTGGMGAYAPVSLDTPALRAVVRSRIVAPTLEALQSDGSAFTGLLYAGLMINRDGPRVVEFNCRFGDPETQALLPLMQSSLLRLVLAVARGDSLQASGEIEWRSAASVTTVLAAAGYPGQGHKGDPISLPAPQDDVFVFHAGTSIAPGDRSVPPNDPAVVTDGGRVLSVTAIGDTLPAAAVHSRDYAARITFAGKQMRSDIAWREIHRIQAAADA
ncbi:MAG: phosphoribosylamine--glycine ligase [Gemmatimonadota bacterium]|nr:phosphoribosylamine--glycine ligase [Gemmatimonadota bacterium]